MEPKKRQPKKASEKPKATEKPKNKFPGRKGHSEQFKKEMFDKLIDWISDGKTVRSFSREHKISFRTLLEWVESSEENEKRYSRARVIQCESIAEEIFEIADDSSEDIRTIYKDGKLIEVENKEFVSRSKLRTDARIWYLSKVASGKYGNKIEVDQKTEHSGSINIPITGMVIKSSEDKSEEK